MKFEKLVAYRNCSAIKEIREGEYFNFNNKVTNKLISIIPELLYEPEIFPLTENIMQLEFDGTDGTYLEITFHDFGSASVFMISKDGINNMFDIPPTINSINDLLAEFIRKN